MIYNHRKCQHAPSRPPAAHTVRVRIRLVVFALPPPSPIFHKYFILIIRRTVPLMFNGSDKRRCYAHIREHTRHRVYRALTIISERAFWIMIKNKIKNSTIYYSGDGQFLLLLCFITVIIVIIVVKYDLRYLYVATMRTMFVWLLIVFLYVERRDYNTDRTENGSNSINRRSAKYVFEHIWFPANNTRLCALRSITPKLAEMFKRRPVLFTGRFGFRNVWQTSRQKNTTTHLPSPIIITRCCVEMVRYRPKVLFHFRLGCSNTNVWRASTGNKYLRLSSVQSCSGTYKST